MVSNGVVEGVCRSVEYYIMAQTIPAGCSNIFISTDPDFNAGFSPVGLLSLPPPNPKFQICIPPAVPQKNINYHQQCFGSSFQYLFS